MAGIILDTSVWTASRPQKLPKNLVMSAVVLQELVAGAAGRAILKALEAARKQYEKEERLLVPTGEDYQAGKILNSLLHNLKSKSAGKTPRLAATRIQTMFRDTLIAADFDSLAPSISLMLLLKFSLASSAEKLRPPTAIGRNSSKWDKKSGRRSPRSAGMYHQKS
jgi:hypothetical protein